MAGYAWFASGGIRELLREILPSHRANAFRLFRFDTRWPVKALLQTSPDLIRRLKREQHIPSRRNRQGFCLISCRSSCIRNLSSQSSRSTAVVSSVSSATAIFVKFPSSGIVPLCYLKSGTTALAPGGAHDGTAGTNGFGGGGSRYREPDGLTNEWTRM